ncbi:MAG: hypothetical protein ACK6DK_10060 [Gemmatimonadota bacterium]
MTRPDAPGSAVTRRLSLVSGNAGAEPPDEDALVAAELRAMLVPPRGAADFAALEARIVAAATRPDDPVPLLATWARPAMLAAAVALVVAVATDVVLRRQERRLEVMNALGMPPAAAAQSAMREDVQREATLQQMLEP